MKGYERILDANQNRCVEGIRVLEDYCRFIRNDAETTQALRELRHFLRKGLSQRWIRSRDSRGDVGKAISSASNLDHKTSLFMLVKANTSRVQESLRVMEEYLKVIGSYDLGKAVEARRYHFYEIEKRLIDDLQVNGLYALTAEGSESDIHHQIDTFLRNDVRWIQYRDKARPKKEIQRIAKDIMGQINQQCQGPKRTRLIINDYPDIAQSIGAHGVHVGQEDMSIEQVRDLAPDLIVGVSTHNRQQFNQAVSSNPDYIALGPIFQTSSKENPEDCEGISFARYARQATDLPLVAIGGINETNIHQVKSAGIDSIAMIAGIKEEANLIKMTSLIGD